MQNYLRMHGSNAGTIIHSRRIQQDCACYKNEPGVTYMPSCRSTHTYIRKAGFSWKSFTTLLCEETPICEYCAISNRLDELRYFSRLIVVDKQKSSMSIYSPDVHYTLYWKNQMNISVTLYDSKIYILMRKGANRDTLRQITAGIWIS